MLIKIIILAAIVFMIYNLIKAMSVMRNPSKNQAPMSTYIGRRVYATVFIVLLLVILMVTGVIQPNPKPF